MGTMALGRNSAWHILRFLGRHRDVLNSEILAETGGAAIDWLDFDFTDDPSTYFDGEICGMDFLFPGEEATLLNYDGLAEEWAAFWPQPRNPNARQGRHNWDAVGSLLQDRHREWLLVEAKAHTAELSEGCCGATSPSSIDTIRTSLERVGASIGASGAGAWADSPYYQYANRLAALWFLLTHGIPARLVYVFFLGDEVPGKDCPNDEDGWALSLAKQDQALGLDRATNWDALGSRVHKVFLPVRGK